MGYSLLGHILEKTSDIPFEQLVHEKITSQFDMKDTEMSFSFESEDYVVGYNDEKETSVKNWKAPPGSGGFRSSTLDLSKFLQANINPDKTDNFKNISLSHMPQFLFSNNTDYTKNMGLGWSILETNNQKILVHNGYTEGFSSFIGFNPDKKLGVVVLSNSEIANEYIGLHLLNDAYPMLEFNLSEINYDILENYVGKYKHEYEDRKILFDVTLSDKKLWIKIDDEDKTRIYPESQTQFFFTDNNQRVEFELDETNNVYELHWWNNFVDDGNKSGYTGKKIY